MPPSKPTAFSEYLHAQNARMQYDDACKRILGNPWIQAWFYSELTDEFRGLDPAHIVEEYLSRPDRCRELNPEDRTIPDHPVIYDKRYQITAPAGSATDQIIVHFEFQNNSYPKDINRWRMVYNNSRLISGQKGTVFQNSNFHQMLRTYSIWIFPHPPAKEANSITYYPAYENLIPKAYPVIIKICLGEPDYPTYTDVLKLLHILVSPEYDANQKCGMLEKEFKIPMTEEFKEEIENMCNVSEWIYQTGVEKGIQTGIQTGSRNTMLMCIRSLMNALKITALQAMSILAVPADEQQQYLDLLASPETNRIADTQTH